MITVSSNSRTRVREFGRVADAKHTTALQSSKMAAQSGGTDGGTTEA
jgi:hypothetical protein